jgi:acylpyruvate hydrolase
MGFDLKEYYVRKATGEEVLVRNIYCIGRNYVEHAKELNQSVPNEPFFFQKSLPSLNISDTIYLPVNREIHYEVEIVLLIGKSGVSKSIGDSLSFINGFTIGIDLTDRNFQNMLKEKQLPWLLSKSFSGSAVVSEFIDEEISDNFWIKINGESRQESNYDNMIFSFQDQIHYLSNKIPLMVGDLIFTGTPSGVGILNKDDDVKIGYGEKLINSLKVKSISN